MLKKKNIIFGAISTIAIVSPIVITASCNSGIPHETGTRISPKLDLWLINKGINKNSEKITNFNVHNYFGKILVWLNENKSEKIDLIKPNSNANKTNYDNQVSIVGITLEEIFEPFDFIQNQPNKKDFLTFIKTLTANDKNFNTFQHTFLFSAKDATKYDISSFFGILLNPEVHLDQKMMLVWSFVANILHNNELNPLLGVLSDSSNNITGDIENFGISIKALKNGNIFSLSAIELEYLFKFVRNNILFDTNGSKTITDASIKLISEKVQKIGQTGISSISSADAESIAQVIVDTFKLSDKKIPKYAGIISNVLSKGINKLTEADLVKLVPMFYYDMHTVLKFDEKIMTVERVANIVYKLLHGWGPGKKEAFVKDISDLVPAIAKVDVHIEKFWQNIVTLNKETIFKLLYDGEWGNITGTLVSGLVSLKPDESIIISHIFKNGLVKTTHELPKLIMALKNLVHGVADSSIIMGFIPSDVKPILIMVDKILVKIIGVKDFENILDKLLNNPIFDLKSADFNEFLTAADSFGLLKDIIKEVDPVKREAMIVSISKIIFKIWTKPKDLNPEDMRTINNLLKNINDVKSIQHHMTIDGDDTFLKLITRLFA